MRPRPKILAYYFPDYHVDPRNERWFGGGWTEWELVRSAIPRFHGHRQPRIPAMGYQDESDPAVAQRSIGLAHANGIDGFIFDYYWYDDGPYLQGALDQGFLRAPNHQGVEFSVMWANHDLLDIFPREDARAKPPTLKEGAIGRRAFEAMARHVTREYFASPHYTRIGGRPRFSIYEVGNFVRGMGGIDQARAALAWFDALARAEGHPGVHFDAVVWGFSVLPAEVPLRDPQRLISGLGFASASSYVWLHHLDFRKRSFPDAGRWEGVADEVFAQYAHYASTLGVPFHPNVTVGWDASPRIAPGAPFDAGAQAYPPVWTSSPEGFEAGLRRAKRFVEARAGGYAEITINAWNEWTEGSYLLPDTVNGTRMLEAVRHVLGPRDTRIR